MTGADLPKDDKVGDWIVFADTQTGKLDMANDRIVMGYATVKRCEERDREAVARATRRRIL